MKAKLMRFLCALIKLTLGIVTIIIITGTLGWLIITFPVIGWIYMGTVGSLFLAGSFAIAWNSCAPKAK